LRLLERSSARLLLLLLGEANECAWGGGGEPWAEETIDTGDACLRKAASAASSCCHARCARAFSSAVACAAWRARSASIACRCACKLGRGASSLLPKPDDGGGEPTPEAPMPRPTRARNGAAAGDNAPIPEGPMGRASAAVE